MDKNIKHLPVKIKKLNQKAKIPTQGSDAAAGYDLYACLDQPISIAPHETVKIGTGIAIALPDDYWGAIYARSGLATKEGMRPANCTGVIDPDYRGEVIVAVHNDSYHVRTVKPGERIAQFILHERFSCDWIEVEKLSETERGDGGFASTGK